MSGIGAFHGLVGQAVASDPFGVGFCNRIKGNRRENSESVRVDPRPNTIRCFSNVCRGREEFDPFFIA